MEPYAGLIKGVGRKKVTNRLRDFPASLLRSKKEK